MTDESNTSEAPSYEIDIYHVLAIRSSESIRTFSGGDPTFIYGDWRAWEAAKSSGIYIPPEDFKKLPKEERRKYLSK